MGIDFGTTYCCVGVWTDGGVVIIPNGIGERTTPSVVIFDSPNEVYVGEETFYHLSKKDSVKIYEIKRLIGKKYSEIENLLDYFPFKIEQGNNNNPIITMTFDNGQTIQYSPEEIASLIIRKLIKNAESFLENKKVNEIIITVPSDFTNTQRNAIKSAAESIEGIKVLQLINEPSASVLSYGFPKQFLKNIFNFFMPFNQNYTLLNYNPQKMVKILHPMEEIQEENLNLNNPFNYSIQTSFLIQESDKIVLVFDFGGGTYDVSLIEVTDCIFETLGTKGNQYLGGGDLDNKLMKYCLEVFSKEIKVSVEEIKKNYKSIQRLKIACEKTKKILSIKEEDTIYVDNFYKEETLNISITRAKFESLCQEYFEKLNTPIDEVLNSSNKKIEDIKEIILVGGSSKIPKVREILNNRFPHARINDSISPDEAVAYGATFYCESLRRNTGEVWEDFQYLDATQHSYGVELEDGRMDVLIPAGSKYPTSMTNYFFNAYDDQYTFEINVYEGENEYVNENELLANFVLPDIPKKPKGECCLQLTFSIDDNQILNVTAHVEENGKTENKKIDKRCPNLNEISTLKLGKISLIGNDLNKKEKRFKLEIMDFTKNFKKMNDDQSKYEIIKNYNKSLDDYLHFLEENYEDFESEKYLYLVDKLFKSYSYFFKTQLFPMVEFNVKTQINQNVESYIEKISKKCPYRIKYLLENFKEIRTDKSNIYITSTIFSMRTLKKRGDEYYIKMQSNSNQIAKNIYEECLIIGKICFNNDKILNVIELEFRREYEEIKEECEDKIKLISADSISEIEKTKLTGNLFSNNKNLDDDNLSLLTFNFNQSLSKLNAIEDLEENKEALLSKAICLANIVKIESLKKIGIASLQNLFDLANESIKIAVALGEICTSKNWYNEINNLKAKIKEKLDNFNPAPHIEEDLENLKRELENKFNEGNEELLRFLLTNHPFEGCQFSENMIEEYRNNKRTFLKKLVGKYKRPNTQLGKEMEKYKIIELYINNMINNLDK